ncbi:MAG TPA: hypothetical protein PLB63_04430 [Planctomycetota bacterium]|nr:hypothetical protein [Planctomycetota bacterium]HQB00360.1 hypothetical protein [Planctomycetota bacterium]
MKANLLWGEYALGNLLWGEYALGNLLWGICSGEESCYGEVNENA